MCSLSDHSVTDRQTDRPETIGIIIQIQSEDYSSLTYLLRIESKQIVTVPQDKHVTITVLITFTEMHSFFSSNLISLSFQGSKLVCAPCIEA